MKQHHLFGGATGCGTAIPTGVRGVARIFPNLRWSSTVMVAVIMLMAGFPLMAKTRPAAPAFHPPADTLVVLPFQNSSGDSKQQNFSDDITAELTSTLGHNPALRVIAWDSASQYRNTSQSATDVGEALNVANVLYGSLAREGDRVRISTKLVNAVTGNERWSHQYEVSFVHVFKVEDRIAEAIAKALQVKFSKNDLPARGTRNPKAHELVLQGHALMYKLDLASYEAARKDFEKALALDPDYADAHAMLAALRLVMADYSGSLKTALPAIRAQLQKALELDPHNIHAILACGDIDVMVDPPNLAKARVQYRKALALDPSYSNAIMDYGFVLPVKPALVELREAVWLDPVNAFAWTGVATHTQDLGEWAEEVTAAKTLLQLDPKDIDSAFYLAFAYQQLRQYDKMSHAFDRVQPTTDVAKQQVATGRLVYQALRDSALRPQALRALKALSRLRSHLGVRGTLLQLYLALDQTVLAQQLLESLCPVHPAACDDLAISPIYRPLRANPRFRQLAKKYTTVTLE